MAADQVAAVCSAVLPHCCFGRASHPSLPAMARGPKKHMKRLRAPKHWMLGKLGGTAQLPALVPPAVGPFNPPPSTGKPDQIAMGQQLFGRYCQVCHGASAGGGGVLPDLQRSGVLADADTWKSILIEGTLSDQGMVSFAKVLSPDQAQLIRLYVIDEANWAKKNLPQGTPARPAAKP